MPAKSLTSDQVLSILAENPLRIAALTAGLAPAQLRAVPVLGEWSANDVLAHLRSCSDVWGGNIIGILAEEVPTLRGVNPRTWIKKTDYPELEFRPSFSSYAAQRAGLLAALRPLTPEGWSRTAMVTAYGQAFPHTALFYADKMARHEMTHVRQIETIVKAIRKE